MIRLDLHLGRITLALVWRMKWRKQDWKQEEFYEVDEIVLVRNEMDLNQGSVSEVGRETDLSCLTSRISGTW